MKDFPEKQLVINYLLGICTSREKRQVIQWLDEDPGNIHLLREVAKNLETESPLSVDDKIEIKENIFDEIVSEHNKDRQPVLFEDQKNSKKRKSSPVFYRLTEFWVKTAAAVLVIATAAMGVFYYNSVNPERTEPVWQQRTLSYGQTATLRFSDGSVIKLNGGSTLRYPQEFDENIREVYLEGEAFFSVARNEARPFIVHAGTITTRVLGTAFNVKAYGNEEKLQVAVAEGKVAVSKNRAVNTSAKMDERVILEKNQWVTYQPESPLLETGEGDIWNMIAWKDQVLVFDNKTFSEAARMLERWYGVEVTIEDEELKKVVLKGEHEDVSLEEVLKSIRFVLGMDYTIDGDVVTISASHNKRINHKN